MPYVERSGVRVHYESYGSGPAMVLLHPMSTNRYFWTHQIFAFARERTVVVVDHRGHGLSDKPAIGYGIGEMAADVVAVLDHAGLDEAVLVGDSVGGMIALQIALVAPDRVTAMVIVSSATHLAPSVPPAILQAYRERFDAAFAFMLRGSTSERTKRERPEVCAYLAGVHGDGTAFLASLEDADGVFGWNIADRLAEIRTPALVIAGAEDQAVPLEATRLIATTLPRAEWKLVPDVGHYFPLERPAEFNAELRAFLARV